VRREERMEWKERMEGKREERRGRGREGRGREEGGKERKWDGEEGREGRKGRKEGKERGEGHERAGEDTGGCYSPSTRSTNYNFCWMN
jgi:hypothetical protein